MAQCGTTAYFWSQSAILFLFVLKLPGNSRVFVWLNKYILSKVIKLITFPLNAMHINTEDTFKHAQMKIINNFIAHDHLFRRLLRHKYVQCSCSTVWQFLYIYKKSHSEYNLNKFLNLTCCLWLTFQVHVNFRIHRSTCIFKLHWISLGFNGLKNIEHHTVILISTLVQVRAQAC